MTSSWREPSRASANARETREAHCRACGSWLVTVPAATEWARGRCGDRRCALYNKAQTVKLR